MDEGQERYAFTWPGKRDAIRQSQTPSTATLRPQKDKSVDWDTTKNLYIEGDNLEVLKLLQRSYHGKVKLIYIDPPYNTGNDFVYNDKFDDPIENYKQQTGQESSANPETDGRYHSNWCNMMYPRLRLARELLSDDGAIFISIDDHEVKDLRAICDEVFIIIVIMKIKNHTKNCKQSFVIETHRIFPFDLNPFGFLFGGKLTSLIDDAASISVSRHCRRGAVTASLDNLIFLKPLHENHSVCIESYVSGTHHKSMEVFVKVIGENLVTGDRYLAATCFTTFVAIPSHMNVEIKFTVPKVVPETQEEKLVCSGYEERRLRRLEDRNDYKAFASKLSTDLPWFEN